MNSFALKCCGYALNNVSDEIRRKEAPDLGAKFGINLFKYFEYSLPDSLLSLQIIFEGNNINSPKLTALSPSTLRVQLISGTRINSRDSWVAIQRFEIVCYRQYTLTHHFKNITGPYPLSVVLSGLANYTTYKCNAYYYGKINGKDFNVESGFESQTTAENGK